MLGDNAYLILDNDWRLKTAVYIAGIQVYGKQVRKLQPPARFAAGHTELVKCANALDTAMDYFMAGLDQLDGSKISQGTIYLEIANAAQNTRVTALLLSAAPK